MADDDESSENFEIRYRNRGGEWANLGDSPLLPSDDPEINKLREGTFGEVKAIRQDPSHPLHEKAKQVLAESATQIPRASSIFSWQKRMARSFRPFIDPPQRFSPLISSVSAHITQAFMPHKLGTRLLEALKTRLPPNWPPDIEITDAFAILQNEGLPLVWVPRQSIVEKMLAMPNKAARVELLRSKRAEIIRDCEEVLADISHGKLLGQLPLVKKALEAYKDGHDEAAQALAVLASDTAVWDITQVGYKKMRRLVSFDLATTSYRRMRLEAALAPAQQFYTEWDRDKGEIPPEDLSRHVTVHKADTDHYTPANALIAVLLATSVMRGLQEFYELSDKREAQGESTPGH